jgi:hypothetical protein
MRQTPLPSGLIISPAPLLPLFSPSSLLPRPFKEKKEGGVNVEFRRAVGQKSSTKACAAKIRAERPTGIIGCVGIHRLAGRHARPCLSCVALIPQSE